MIIRLRTIAIATSLTLVGAVSLPAQDTNAQPAPDPKTRFDKLDADKNGSISKEEFTSVAKNPAKIEMVSKVFLNKDTNGDGSLSLEEFSASARKKTEPTKAENTSSSATE